MKNKLKRLIIIPVLAFTIFFTGSAFQNDFFEIAKQIEIFTTLFKEINMNYVDETNPAELMNTAIKSMLKDLDPYTNFYNEQDVEAERIRRTGDYTGIGAKVRTLKDRLVIVEPYKEYPADKAGLKAGDEIIKVGEVVISNYKDDAGDLLKGTSNSSVEVTYLRQEKEHKATIKRSEIEIDAVPHFSMIDDKTGYIVLSTFNNKASSQTGYALKDLKAQGAQRIILDLRNNPGGLLHEAVNVVNLFVPKGQLVVTTKSKVKKYNRTYYTLKDAIDTEIPLVVLINGSSASASEIVSGSLQDLDRAVIIGARSFGKGLVQRPKALTYGTQIKVTISRYYTPSGRCIQALDYWDRDENGDPIRKDTKEYNEFKTRGGRSVYDGGGILPDIELESAVYSSITTALLKDNAIFDYATKYYYSNKMNDWKNYKFTDSDFEDFLKFLKQNEFSYKTETEKKFAEGLKTAQDEDLDKEISSGYAQLMKSIDQAKDKAIKDKKIEIESLLVAEIMKRYFYREGLYNYQIENNPEILEGISVLKNEGRYKKILK